MRVYGARRLNNRPRVAQSTTSRPHSTAPAERPRSVRPDPTTRRSGITRTSLTSDSRKRDRRRAKYSFRGVIRQRTSTHLHKRRLDGPVYRRLRRTFGSIGSIGSIAVRSRFDRGIRAGAQAAASSTRSDARLTEQQLRQKREESRSSSTSNPNRRAGNVWRPARHGLQTWRARTFLGHGSARSL